MRERKSVRHSVLALLLGAVVLPSPVWGADDTVVKPSDSGKIAPSIPMTAFGGVDMPQLRRAVASLNSKDTKRALLDAALHADGGCQVVEYMAQIIGSWAESPYLRDPFFAAVSARAERCPDAAERLTTAKDWESAIAEHEKREAGAKVRTAAALAERSKALETVCATDRKACDAINKRSIFVGMKREHVLLAWGKPLHVNVTVDARGKSEQMVYPSHQYVYVANGVVTAMQGTE